MKDLGLYLNLPSGAKVQLNSVPAGIVEKVSLFFCCSQCGKIFWEGSHFGRVVSQFKEVLQDQGESFYQSTSQGLWMDYGGTRSVKYIGMPVIIHFICAKETLHFDFIIYM